MTMSDLAVFLHARLNHDGHAVNLAYAETLAIAIMRLSSRLEYGDVKPGDIAKYNRERYQESENAIARRQDYDE